MPTLTFDQCVNQLSLPASAEAWREGWEQSQQSFPTGPPYFVSPAWVGEQCARLEYSSEFTGYLVKAVLPFAEDATLQRLLWHVRWLLFDRPGNRADVAGWPSVNELPERWGCWIYPLAIVAGAPNVWAMHAERGIAREVTIDTMADLEVHSGWYRETNARWGLANVGWMTNHIGGILFRLGRLQFQLHHMHLNIHVWQRPDKRTVALAGQGMRFRADGQFDGSNEIYDSEAWEAFYQADDGEVVGSPFSPLGHALHETVRLPSAEWSPVCELGAPTLNLHIPATGPLDVDSCGASMRAAGPFFAKHFPEFNYRAFTCYSWLMDPQLAQYLPANSNLVGFMNEFYLLPMQDTNATQTYERVLGGVPADSEAAPRQTSLQRAVVEHVRRGGQWRGGGGFILKDDLDWGGQVYRR